MGGYDRKRKATFAASVLLMAVVFFSGIMSVFAWSDFTQSKTNDFTGMAARTTVTLHKYEKDRAGNIMPIPVRNAEFQLFRAEAEDRKTQVGGLYQTDVSGKITVEHLSPGNYYFKETNPGYGYEYDKDSQGADIREYPFTVTADAAKGMAIATVDAYNRRLTSSLEVRKTVTGAGADPERQFAFSATFSDGKEYPYRLNGTGDEIPLDGGTFLLRHGEYALFEGLPVGVHYQVTERPDPGYITQSTNNQGNIALDEKSVAEFHNVWNEDGSGSLEIKKTVSGDLSDTEDSFFFQADFSPPGTYSYKKNGTGEAVIFTSGDTLALKHDEYALFENLPVGTSYAVTETSAGENGYTASAGSISGKIIPGTVQALFNNHKDSVPELPGSLEIKKTVTGAVAGGRFTFTVTFTGDGAEDQPFAYTINGVPSGSITNSGTIELGHGETAVFTGLPPGVVYEVTEAENSGYIAGITGYQGVIPSGSSAYAYFHNHRKGQEDVRITVEKIVKGEIPESEKGREFWFTFQRNGETPVRFSLKDGEKKSFTVSAGDTYSVTEDDPFQYSYIQTSAVNAYGTASGTEILVKITNTYVGTVFTGIQGEKTWDLNGASESVVPDSITVYLKDGDTEVASKKVTREDDWEYHFTVPKYDKDGREIKYTIEEAPVDGFVTSIDGFHITNVYEPQESTSVTVAKAWEDGNSAQRPESANVQLYKDCNAYGAPVTLNRENGWIHTWNGLEVGPAWTVDEPDVPAGYTREVTGNAASGFVITNSKAYDPGETVRVSGSKSWEHGSNPVGSRPESITVYIKDGETLAATKEVSESTHWQWHFDLPKYRADGTEIVYTVDEAPVSGYTKEINGYNIRNVHHTFKEVGEKVTVSGSKTWEHGGIASDNRPSSIIVYIKSGGKTIVQKQVTADDGWKWSVEVPKYEDDGKTPATYTVEEGNVPYYTHKVKGYNINNTYVGMDYPGDSPGTGAFAKTGDNSPVLAWIITLAASLAVLAALAVYGRRGRYKR